MKRVGGLFDRVVEVKNLVHAAHLAALGKRDRGEVRQFFADFERQIGSLGERLRSGRYTFGPYTSFAIRDPKTRIIQAPPFRDRVVHHAMIAIGGPILERGASDHSHACRVGMGQSRSMQLARRRPPHAEAFLKLDVAKFYDSIDHEVLRRALARRFRETRLLDLFDRLLASYHTSEQKGLPIGALTSQYLGNFYLDGLDRWAERQPTVVGYQRYMDDMLFFGRLEDLAAIRRAAVEQLAGLKLMVKNGGVLNRCALGVPWLGFTLYPDRTRLNANARRRLGRKLCALQRATARGHVDELEQQQRATALFAHARHADDVGWRRAVLARTRHREVLEPAEPRDPRRLVQRLREEVPLRVSQQEEARQPQQEEGLPRLLVPRHGESVRPPDVAPSGALVARATGDEPCGRAPAEAEIQGMECPAEKASVGVPPRLSEDA